MDLKLEDVAKLLNVSETTVLKWLDEGLIPSYSIHQIPRFSRIEIENWMLNKKGPLEESFSQKDSYAEGESAKKGWQQFSLYRAIHKGLVLNIEDSGRKEDIIRQVMQLSGSCLNLDEEVLTELLIDREKMMPTAINNGIAVPHTRDFLLRDHNDILIVVYLKHPMEWGAMDGLPVNTLFFLFACDDRHHLNLLAKLAHLSSDENSLKKLVEKPEKTELLSYIKEWESGIKQ